MNNATVFNKVLNPRRNTVVQLARQVAGLFLPDLCAGCDRPLMRHEMSLCQACLDDLPLTRAMNDPDNSVASLFKGRVQLEAAGALLRFDRAGKVQRILHRLKYRSDEGAGLALGRLMGRELKACDRFATVDTVMAVPLHASKERARGFNQSQVLVNGILEEWPLRKAHHALMRVARTPSQTRKGRLDRWRNVKEAFQLEGAEDLRGAHVLVVDDVVTTGATLESCVRVLQTVPHVRVSVCAAACA